MLPNPQFSVDLVTFTEEILHGKLHFLCSGMLNSSMFWFNKIIGKLIFAKPVVILKLGLRSISKSITSFIFLNIYTPPKHTLTRIVHTLLK